MYFGGKVKTFEATFAEVYGDITTLPIIEPHPPPARSQPPGPVTRINPLNPKPPSDVSFPVTTRIPSPWSPLTVQSPSQNVTVPVPSASKPGSVMVRVAGL